MLSHRAAAFAVIVALLVGIIGSLAVRPPGHTGDSVTSQSRSDTRVPGTPLTPIRWRLPVAFPSSMPVLGDNPIAVARLLAQMTNGDIQLKLFEPGELIPAFSIVDAVRDGKVEAGYTWLGYDQGKIPASALLGAVPFGMEPVEMSAWWYEAGGKELAEALYTRRGVHPILCGITGPETAGWFRKPITSLADIHGLKIRFAGLGGKVLQKLGASVTMLPGGEIFQALEKGAIDATEFALPVVDQALGFNRVARYNYYPGWHQPATSFHLVINLKSWQALSTARQVQFQTACTAGVTLNLARSEALQGPIIAGFSALGVSAESLPLPLLRELEQTSKLVMQEEARKDQDFAEILKSQQKFRSDYQHWKSRAYLPRDF